MPSEVTPVLFHYSLSPYGRRVSWYLTFRGIQHKQCLQPPILPRPDLAALGVQYRRIPVLSIGKDIYCDSRLILKKLEEQFPNGKLGATDSDGKALENLLETWATDGGLFLNAALLMPFDMPALQNPAFLKDRSSFITGLKLKMEDMPSLRAEAMVQVKRAFDFLESTLLADGRDWLRKTEKPTLADLQASSLEVSHPKVFAWRSRFRQALSDAEAKMKETIVSGSDVLEGLRYESFAESEAEFDDSDPLGLQKGEEVLVWPTDSGSTHRDAGTLIGLNSKEIVLQRKTEDNQLDIRIHFPRINFKVVSAAHVQQTKLGVPHRSDESENPI
ncbi:hypothetical protein MGYG_03964 [Nannizzia gypsea CBS 118893]|uniref:Uncharacterized protein n=1 Tax=Arthroderma gypseum (strain ATCC MYA-4604 / CBS 118893) TaxID=535722 RepID=E4UUJ5_ARTGP|nr:hypothetical protein MGYG_03964 [Nannizzia gypsea CBS 118893]EFR00962.1 hypothetical protein MGYG_03964 [Nannizzia gypsea CBS 118893]